VVNDDRPERLRKFEHQWSRLLNLRQLGGEWAGSLIILTDLNLLADDGINPVLRNRLSIGGGELQAQDDKESAGGSLH
jgi:hypothetical protein